MSLSNLVSLRTAIRENYLPDEAQALSRLVSLAGLSDPDRSTISARAAELVRTVRDASNPQLMEVFLTEYGLSTREGVALMCLAEALLRVPDSETMDDLIADKIAPHDWSARTGSSSIFVNASTWALMLTGRVLEEGEGGVEGTLRSMVRRLGEPVIRKAVSAAMREMGEQFVLGRTIDEAIKRGREYAKKGYRYSFDMLGEAARTEKDALRYHRAYADAIRTLATTATDGEIAANHGISVKLSAIHPRYEFGQKETMLPVMVERLTELALAARDARMGLNIDAEEADRLDLSLDVIEQTLADPRLAGWDGFGVVVQAYGPRAPYVIDWLYALAQELDRRIMVRLVKGAYWDTEIKRAQVMGLSGYPVFTRKANTDISYIACAKKLLGMSERIYPQFATHNAHTVAAILALANGRTDQFEFQRLHGMGEALHEAVRAAEGTRCRIYAPVGAHSDLLAYLVRRLLENGANSSFVHQIVDKSVSPEEIARDPFGAIASQPAANPAIARPAEIFGNQRRNSKGWDITDPVTLAEIDAGREKFASPYRWRAGSGKQLRTIVNPAQPDEIVGEVFEADQHAVTAAIDKAIKVQPSWAQTPVDTRAAALARAADLYEENASEFFALCAREAGKTLADAVAELREAVDFLRYYAAEAGAAEEQGIARGVIACISPWNFPLAIFTGQVAAALVTGNAVIAKPAEQTPLIAARAVALLHEAGIPEAVLQMLAGDGPSVGGPLTADPRLAGVCFTGSTEVARLIERQLASSAAPDAMLIAETGGLNAMIVDSTALPEQAVRDIIASAFQSAGQRCSALRVLYVQKDIEDRLLEMLAGAMASLNIGDPWSISNDVGPVIDDDAQSALLAYCNEMEEKGQLVARLNAPANGRFVAPTILRVSGIGELAREMFGPVLHVASFAAEELDKVIAEINRKGYGLTFGLHTRIDVRVQHIVDGVRAGNIYVNRNQIGAVVGSQPFGGEGLSGTGPKAGGPHYLRRFRKPKPVIAPPEAATSETATLETAKSQMEKNEPASTMVSRQAMRDHLPDPSRGNWSGRPDRIEVLRKHLRGKAAAAVAASAALDSGPVDLPGPTGEANSLLLVPRGRVICLGPDAHTLLAQVVQALAAGNAVLAICPGAHTALAPLIGKDVPLGVLEGIVNPDDLNAVDVNVVASAGDLAFLRQLRHVLAADDGAIVRLVTAELDPIAYTHERAICVDTTAAGGNASLLAAAE